jgi:hypothetical protein
LFRYFSFKFKQSISTAHSLPPPPFQVFSSSSSPIKMKLLTLASTLLLVGSAVAAPNTAKRFAGHAKRAANSRTQGKPINRVSSGPEAESSNNTFVEYSSNWAGAVLIGTGYKSVTGTFTVPTPSTDGSGAAWVGIDGDTCGTAILRRCWGRSPFLFSTVS